MTAKTSYARVREAPETLALGLVGQVGVVLGWTRPSYSEEPTVGLAPDDFAYGVYFDALKRSFFLRPELLDPVSLAPDGTVQDDLESPEDRAQSWRDVSQIRPPPPQQTPITRLLARLESLLPRF